MITSLVTDSPRFIGALASLNLNKQGKNVIILDYLREEYLYNINFQIKFIEGSINEVEKFYKKF